LERLLQSKIYCDIDMTIKLSKNYENILTALKEKIKVARWRASLSVNTQLLTIYWEIGNTILEQQREEGWGTKIIERLSNDLKSEFPDMKGLSTRNIKYMRAFAQAYPDFLIEQSPVEQIDENQIMQVPLAQMSEIPIVQAVLAQLSWYHHITLLDKIKNKEVRIFYIKKTIQNGWSRNVMVHQIETELHKRQGKAITNFENTLPKLQSDLAKEVIKNPYNFDFLAMGEEIQERELEKALISHIKKFILELGRGFAYVGNQENLVVEEDDYFPDLLFYNYHLHCFVVFELKVGPFKPEFSGKLNFYINAIDAKRSQEDKPTIGVLLCKTPNKTVVQYSLQGIKTPIGVAEYELMKALPKQFKAEMPTVEELELELEKETEKFLKPSDKKMHRLKELLSELKQEEVKEKHNPVNSERIYTKVLLPLKKKVALSLKEVFDMFDQSYIKIGVDNNLFSAESEARTELEKRKQCYNYTILLDLIGFKKAGIKAFNAGKYLYITLEEYKYTIDIDQSPRVMLLEKLYHQFPTKKEIEMVVDTYCEIILDDISIKVGNLVVKVNDIKKRLSHNKNKI
jgi:predicted nuclease of restriction endonuclease-like (RecB) superfamily